jgi:hypothetical protein
MINTQKINRFKKWKILNLIALPLFRREAVKRGKENRSFICKLHRI